MNYKAWILAVILGVLALVPCLYLVYDQNIELPIVQPIINSTEPVIADFEFEIQKEKELNVGVEFNLNSCKVLDGYRFQLSLEGGKQITAHLTAATKDEATTVVVGLLTEAKSTRPTIILRRKTGDYWIVDFYVSLDGKRVNLIEDLRAKELLF